MANQVKACQCLGPARQVRSLRSRSEEEAADNKTAGPLARHNKTTDYATTDYWLWDYETTDRGWLMVWELWVESTKPNAEKLKLKRANAERLKC